MSKIIAADLNLSQNQIINVLAHVNATDIGSPIAGQFYYNSASNVMKFYNGTSWVVLANIGNMDSAVADVEMGGFNITGLPATPSGTSAAASKAYVDSVCEGLDVKTACRVATTANLASLATLLTIDGITLVAGDRVLVKNQTALATNGIYVAATGSWARATDCDSWEDLFAAYTVITEGTAGTGTSWVCTIKLGGTLGSTDITWSQFSAASTITSSNTGVTTYGLAKAKIGNDLPFKSLTATSTAVVLASNTDDVGINLSTKLTGIHGSSTAGFVANATSTLTPRTFSATAPAEITNGTGAGNPVISINLTTLHATSKFSKYFQGTFAFVSTGATITITHSLALATPYIPTFTVFETTSKALVEVEVVSASCTTNAFAIKMTGTGFNTGAGYYSIVLVG